MVDTFAHGVNKVVAIGAETTFGTASSAAGQILRRIQCDLSLTAQPIESQEIVPDGMLRDARQGPRMVRGNLSGQLSNVTYSMLFASLLRGSWAFPFSNITGISDSTLTFNSGTGIATFTSSSQTFVATGVRVGDVVYLSGLTGGAAALNFVRLPVIAATNTALSFPMPAKYASCVYSSGQTTSVSFVGKKLLVPVASSQVFSSFTVEQWHPDTAVSELFTGTRVNQISINIPASGFVTMQAGLIGQNMATSGSQVFASATSPTTTRGLTAVGGELLYRGAPIAVVTSMSIQISANTQADPVVGSNVVPEIYQGMIAVRGSFTCMVSSGVDAIMMSDFLNENEVGISMWLTGEPASSADFICIGMQRVKVFAGPKSDGDRALMRTYSFIALNQDVGSSSYDPTLITVQDSLMF